MKRTSIIAMALAGVMALPALAQDRQQDQQRQQSQEQQRIQQQQQQDQARERQQQQQTKQLTGTIDDLRVVGTETDERHLIVRVQPDRAQRGQFMFVDLGPANQIDTQRIQLDRGANIRVTGALDQIDGRRVLVADRITVNGQRYTLDQPQRQTARQQQQRYQEQQTQREQRTRLYRAPGHQDQAQTQRERQQQQQQARAQAQADQQRRAQLQQDRSQAQRDTQQSQTQREQMRRQAQMQAEQQRRAQAQTDQQRRAQQQQSQARRGESSAFGYGQDRLPVIRGEVVSLRDFSIDGVKDKHRLIKISDARNRDRNWVVDLGPANALDQLDLKEGDRVLVQGQAGRLEGKPIVRAVQIAEVVELTQNVQSLRSAQQQPQQRSQAQREQQRAGAQQQQDAQREETESMRSKVGKPKTASEKTNQDR